MPLEHAHKRGRFDPDHCRDCARKTDRLDHYWHLLRQEQGVRIHQAVACHAHRFAMWALWLAGSSILLVIEIRPPEFHALRAQWPSYVAYLVSFLTIGVIRLNHHRVFEQVARVDGPLLLLNLNLLLWTELVPFPTAVVAEHLGDGGEAAQTAAALYCGVLLVMGLAFGALFAWVTHDDRRAVTTGP
jgi:Endosomal/lysosomal potassium channel TMEM175